MSPSDDERALRPGPLWRHAVWVVGLTIVAVAMGWVAASYRVGPDHYGIPLAVPGQVWPFLAFWTMTGLLLAGAMRAVAARVPLYGPDVLVLLLIFAGTRLSLGYRPESLQLGALAAAALVAAGIWCAVALRHGRRDDRAQRVTSGG